MRITESGKLVSTNLIQSGVDKKYGPETPFLRDMSGTWRLVINDTEAGNSGFLCSFYYSYICTNRFPPTDTTGQLYSWSQNIEEVTCFTDAYLEFHATHTFWADMEMSLENVDTGFVMYIWYHHYNFNGAFGTSRDIPTAFKDSGVLP